MQQLIAGYHKDEERHWVAELTCGHNQHVRHDPPWTCREWVTTSDGRDSMLGYPLDCLKCDEQVSPDLSPRIISIQVGRPQTFSDRQPWTSSFIKEPTMEPIWLGATNLTGDEQADLTHHGGPHKAVCVYPAIHVAYWRDQLQLPKLWWGDFGENFTVSGLTEQDVCIGDVWSAGDVLVQVSQPRQPCWKLARRWDIKDLAMRVQQAGFTGWYFRVLEQGLVQRGMPLQLVGRTQPEWTVAAANHLMHHNKLDRQGAKQLASVAELSPSWQSTLTKRAESGQQSDQTKRLTND